jgi:hypothetical protein
VTDKMDNSFLTYASDILADTKKGLPGRKIIEHCNNYAIEFNVTIPIDNADFGRFGSRVKNKSTALLRNLQAFNVKQQFRIIKELCELDCFSGNKDAKKLKEQLYVKYGFLAEDNLTNTELVVKTKHWLANYSDALQEYNNALTKYESGSFERNTLDDMRLSFELLIKALLNNNKSLENQMSDLGSMLKASGVSDELRNMVSKIIDYYSKYQNNHVKHNSAVKSDEIEYVIEQTSIIMKFLIKINGGN